MAKLLGNCVEAHEPSAESRIEPMHASMQDLKNGKWCTSEKHGQPGTIANVKMSKTGKHGHAKFTFNLSFPFTGQTSQEMYPGHTHLHRPIVKKDQLQVTAYDYEEEVTCIDEQGKEVYLVMKSDFEKDGKLVGQEFMDAYDEAMDSGQTLYVDVMEGPVYAKKAPGKANKDYYIRQIVSWVTKDDEKEG